MMLNAIEKDYRGTGKCLLALAREPDYSFSMMVDFEKTESHVQKFHRSVLRSDSRLRSFFRRVYWRKNLFQKNSQVDQMVELFIV